MAKNVTLTTIAVAALFLAPAAAATWSSYGAYEPDTPWDTPSLMWQNAPGTITNRVYFNAFVQYVDGGPNGGVVNPNVGALQTRFDPAGDRAFEAVLGVWTDCNQDGYIGMADTAVREYKSELLDLLGQSICPPSGGHSIGAPWNGANNYNGWVSELIPIGNKETTKADKRIWKDDAAMVWGDPGQPNDAAAQVEPGCPPLNPYPGAGRTVGGILYQADCNRSRGVLDAWDTALGPAGLGWGEDPASSGSPLNYDFGDEDSSNSAVYLQDCSQEPLLTTGTTPPGGDLDNIPILRPVPANPVGNDPTNPNVAATMNATIETFEAIPDDSLFANSTSNCDYEDDRGHDFYAIYERNPAASAVDGKNRATWNFVFNTATRGSLPANFVGAGAAGVPTDFGVEPTTAGCTHSGCMQSFWIGTGSAVYTPGITRHDLQTSVTTGDVQVAHAPHYSFYAYVGGMTTDRGFVTPGGSGTYGSAQCGAATDGELNGWNCNPDEWYLLADGTPQNEPRPFARVGQTYLFRDVDCYDGGAGALGVGISPAFYGDRPCPIV